uniref:DUF1758 domain-containing protein n=1 Tax=Ascaris lumbricoides TaxID=6252 RepID=A0A0M3IFY6_ASCLU
MLYVSDPALRPDLLDFTKQPEKIVATQERADIDRERELELFRKSQTDEFLYTLELAREKAVTISANIQQIEQTLRELSPVPPLTNQPATNATASTVHLPKLDLKPFDGACALRTHASTVVDALKKHYERPEAIVNALYDELEHLPRAREGQLAELTENIDRVLELLAHQGEPTNTRPFQHIIERKLPRRVLEKLEQAKAVTREWTVDLMRENLAAMVIADENIARALPHDPILERTKRTKEDVNLNLAADLAPPSEPKVQTLATKATFASSQQVARPQQALLRCLEVNVVNPVDKKLHTTVLAMLDSGSQRSYLEESVARQLGLRGTNETLQVAAFATPEPIAIPSNRVEIIVSDL